MITHPKQKGEITEAVIIAELLKREVKVSKPIGDNQPFDLVIYNESLDKFFRIQCKTARKTKQSKSHGFDFNDVSTRINTKGNYTVDYIGKIDYFLVYYPVNNKVYVFDINDYPLNLRIDAPLNNQKKNIYMAEDYELDLNIGIFI